MSTVRVLLKAQEAFAFDPLERDVSRASVELWKRWEEVVSVFVRRVQKSLADDILEQIAALEAMTQQMHAQTKRIVDEMTGRGMSYGVILAGTEDAQYPQIQEKQVDALMKQNTFLDSQAYAFAQAHAMNSVTTKDAALLGSFKAALLTGLQQGDNPRDIAQQWGNETAQRSTDWERIARTESARALSFGFYQEAKRLGKDAVYIPPQPRACAACKRLLIGRVFPLAALEGASNQGRAPSAWIPAIPLHPNCTCLPIPASNALVQQAQEKAEGANLPNDGIKVEAIQPHLR